MLENSKKEICLALKLVADPHHHPILIHCTHGKDRTGVISALILACLGVPEEGILKDYSASEYLGGTALCTQDLKVYIYIYICLFVLPIKYVCLY